MHLKPDASRLEPLAMQAAELLKALSHPARLMIVCQLKEGEMSVGEIERTLGIKQPNLSRELAKLRQEGVLETRRESKLVFYRLADPRALQVVDALCAAFLGQAPKTPAPETRARLDAPAGYGVFARAFI